MKRWEPRSSGGERLPSSCTAPALGVERSSWVSEGQEAKRIGSALVSAGLVELALFTMT
jgi:hypothetical protein